MYLKRDLVCSNGLYKSKLRIKNRTTDRGRWEVHLQKKMGKDKCYACRYLIYLQNGRIAQALDADMAICELDRHVIAKSSGSSLPAMPQP